MQKRQHWLCRSTSVQFPSTSRSLTLSIARIKPCEPLRATHLWRYVASKEKQTNPQRLQGEPQSSGYEPGLQSSDLKESVVQRPGPCNLRQYRGKSILLGGHWIVYGISSCLSCQQFLSFSLPLTFSLLFFSDLPWKHPLTRSVLWYMCDTWKIIEVGTASHLSLGTKWGTEGEGEKDRQIDRQTDKKTDTGVFRVKA